jgi:hypothetical protein
MRAEVAMTSKPDIGSGVAGVIHQIERQADALSERADGAQKIFAGWETRARRFVRNNPGTVLVGAVALGFILARAARHA